MGHTEDCEHLPSLGKGMVLGGVRRNGAALSPQKAEKHLLNGKMLPWQVSRSSYWSSNGHGDFLLVPFGLQPFIAIADPTMRSTTLLLRCGHSPSRATPGDNQGAVVRWEVMVGFLWTRFNRQGTRLVGMAGMG